MDLPSHDTQLYARTVHRQEPTARRSRIPIFFAGLFLAAFTYLAVEVVGGRTTAFYEAVLQALRTPGDPSNPIGPPWLADMGRDVTAFGSFAFLAFISAAAIGYLLITRHRSYALQVTVALVGGELSITILKNAFDRPRPEIPQTPRVFTASFPSGHAMLSAVAFLTLGAMLAHANSDPRLERYFMAMAIFLTVMVGCSRLYLGVHYPTDVLAGWCVGSAWALLCWAGSKWLEPGS